MNTYSICLDVGGTSIKAGLVQTITAANGSLQLESVEHSYKSYPSKSEQDFETIIDNFIAIIREQYEYITDSEFTISAISFGFPGPFDYANGISLMQGIGKFDSIYNIDIKSEIIKKLAALHLARLPADIKIVFENDATLFALGEYHINKLSEKYRRIIFITLGTGCGSTFLANGKIVKGEFGVPINGMIYNAPFREGIIDDYISRRYILSLANKANLDTAKVDVKELELLSQQGNTTATEIFNIFGNTLGKALKPFIESFNAQAIVFGGQISKGYPLFKEAFETEILPSKPIIILSQNLSRSALIGAAFYANSYL